jgi:hypothetical protein
MIKRAKKSKVFGPLFHKTQLLKPSVEDHKVYIYVFRATNPQLTTCQKEGKCTKATVVDMWDQENVVASLDRAQIL